MEENVSTSDRIALWISLIVPGIITALVDFDISIFVTYAVVASLLGEKTIWLLVLVYAILHLLNSISGKIVIVADKGLIELIREHFGVAVSLFVFITVGFLDLLIVFQSFLAVRFVADLFRIDFLSLSLVISLYLFFVFILKFQKFTNRVFVIIGLFFASVLIQSFDLAPAVARSIIHSKFLLQDLFHADTDLYFLALLGSTASAWNQFLISRYTYRTKLDLDKLRYQTLDNRMATLSTFIFGALFVSVMAILFPGGRLLAEPGSLVRFIPVTQPVIQLYFFAIGFLFIAITNMYAVTLSFSHTFTEFFGIERSDEERGKFSIAHILLFLLLVIPSVYLVHVTGMQLLPTAIPLGYIQFLFIFLLLYFLYRFANNRSIMGRYRNDKIHNVLLLAITLFLLFILAEVFIKTLFHI